MGQMVNQNQLKCLRGKRVLLTGDTGFKGSWLAYWLHELGAEVLGVALPPETQRGPFGLLDLGKMIRHVDLDIRDFSVMQKAFLEFRPEVLFHLAAQPIVRKSYQSPRETFETNVSGTVNVLEAIRHTDSLRAAIIVTSDKCYKNHEWLWGYRENDELGGIDPYSASKAAAELVFSSYQQSFFSQSKKIGLASVRAGNVIGGGDWAEDRIVPDCIRAIQAGRPIILRNPGATRPWQHVLEPLGGYLTLAVRLLDDPVGLSGSWNFGPAGSSCCTVQQLATGIVSRWGSGSIELTGESSACHEARFLQLNCDKAERLLGWRPRWNFDDTLTQTVDWYRVAHDRKSALQMMSRQVELFMQGEGLD